MTRQALTNGPFGFLKRRHYLYLLPITILAFQGGWLLLELSGHTATSLSRISVPLMGLWLTGLWFAFWKLRLYPSLLVIGFLASLGLYFFLQLVHSLYLAPSGVTVAERLAQFAFWLPALFGLSFLALGSTWGRITALLFLAFTVVVSIPFVLLRNLSTTELFALLQLFLSNGVIIYGLTILGGLIERFEAKSREFQTVAYTDVLTRISNRRQLAERLKEEIAQAQRYGTVFSIILLDIDHFKKVNDTYGHEVGDKVLCEFAEVLTLTSRTVDTVGRWGGEEFLVLLPQVALEEATLFGSRLRQRIEHHTFRRIGNMTACLGVTAYRCGDTEETLLKRADDALYDAKCGGRNRVAVRDQPNYSLTTVK